MPFPGISSQKFPCTQILVLGSASGCFCLFPSFTSFPLCLTLSECKCIASHCVGTVAWHLPACGWQIVRPWTRTLRIPPGELEGVMEHCGGLPRKGLCNLGMLLSSQQHQRTCCVFSYFIHFAVSFSAAHRLALLRATNDGSGSPELVLGVGCGPYSRKGCSLPDLSLSPLDQLANAEAIWWLVLKGCLILKKQNNECRTRRTSGLRATVQASVSELFFVSKGSQESPC